MVTETKTKKNTDYSGSAVKLCNPKHISVGLNALKVCQDALAQVQTQIQALIPEELKTEIELYTKEIAQLNIDIRKEIDNEGSYQDLDNGWYAVKQQKITMQYEPALVREKLNPKYAEMVIRESVDTVAIGGLIKGGFITQEQARECGTEKVNFAYIVKV